GTVGAAMLAGGIGVGLGAIIRRQTATIVAILLWLLIGESVISAVGDAARFAPRHAPGPVVAPHAPRPPGGLLALLPAAAAPSGSSTSRSAAAWASWPWPGRTSQAAGTKGRAQTPLQAPVCSGLTPRTACSAPARGALFAGTVERPEDWLWSRCRDGKRLRTNT